MLHQETSNTRETGLRENRRGLRLLIRSFDGFIAGLVALLLALGFGLPTAPAIVLGLGSGLLASTLCPVARRSGPSLIGAIIGGLLSGALAAAFGVQAWPQVALVVLTSLLAVKLGRQSIRGLAKALLRSL